MEVRNEWAALDYLPTSNCLSTLLEGCQERGGGSRHISLPSNSLGVRGLEGRHSIALVHLLDRPAIPPLAHHRRRRVGRQPHGLTLPRRTSHRVRSSVFRASKSLHNSR